MKMQYLALGLIAVFLIGGGFYFVTQSSPASVEIESSQEQAKNMPKDTENMMKDEVMIDSEGAMMEKNEGDMTEDAAVMMKSGRYEPFAADKIKQATKGPVVLFFKASWCPTCKAVDADIRKNADSLPTGTVILEVDYDNSSELKKKYGVTYQHTFVQVDPSGALVTKWSGSPTLASLLTNIKN